MRRRCLDGGYTIAVPGHGRFELTPQNIHHSLKFYRMMRSKLAKKLKIRVGGSFFNGPDASGRWTPKDVSPFERIRVLDPVPDREWADAALKNVTKTFPELQGVRVVQTWAGVIDTSPDLIPVICASRAIPGWLFYIYFVMPDLGITMSSFQAAIIGLGFAHSAYMSEIFRGGIQAVDAGQMEAARTIGMGKVKAMWRVVLPQAFRVALPPFSSGVVTLVKDSALSSTIAVTEMTRQGQLLASSTFQNTTVYTMVAIGCLIINLPLIRATKFFERRIGKSF